MNINNIKFEINENNQEFSFTDSNGNWHYANLQLPKTPDSINLIENEEWNDEEKSEIYAQLRDYFYSQFKSKEHGKASIIAGFNVTHLIEVKSYTVAFNAEQSAVLKEDRAASYYNVFCFEKAFFSGEEDTSEKMIIKRARKQLFSDLGAKLKYELENYSSNVNFDGDSKDIIAQCFNDLVHDFMIREFETREYETGDVSSEFYQFYACDIRNDATPVY
jgi:hypothetical protein